MYRSAVEDPPSTRLHPDDVVERLRERASRLGKWLDRSGYAIALAAGATLLWLTRDEASWGLRKILYLVLTFVLVGIARDVRKRIVRRRLRVWIADAAPACGVDGAVLWRRVWTGMY